MKGVIRTWFLVSVGWVLSNLGYAGTINLISPNGGDIIPAGSTNTITWSSTDSGQNILLEYSSDQGIDWGVIATVENNGFYLWQVPVIVSDDCLIRISDADNSSTFDISNSVFSIHKNEWYYFRGHQYALTLKHSDWLCAESEAISVGGYLVTVNDLEERNWLLDTAINPFGNVFSYCCPDSGPHNAIWVGLKYAEGDIHSQESWQWMSGEPITFWDVAGSFYGYAGTHMLMTGTYHPTGAGQFSNPPHFDEDPQIYILGIIEYIPKINILTPKSGDFVPNQYLFTIQWELESKIPVPQVNIELSVNSGTTWETIGQVDNTGSYAWSIPNVVFDQCILRISDPNDPAFSSTVPFKVGQSPHVYFADANLKAAVESKLGITNPTVEDMLKLTYLDARNRGITSLIGLETALNLTTLYLNQNAITDITPLAGLIKLTVLNLYSNKISDISPLSGLMKLYNLAISTNNITDISPLINLNSLIYLYMSYNQINDFSALAGNTKFKEIYAIKNSILTKDTYLNHIPTIRANNPNLTVFQHDPGCQTLRITDVNQDCRVDLMDLVMIASDWLTCNHFYEKMCP